tara:strand:+ start:804 stop:1106 length:303 start_codon:yes stop_codon:yes gene_type:complete
VCGRIAEAFGARIPAVRKRFTELYETLRIEVPKGGTRGGRLPLQKDLTHHRCAVLCLKRVRMAGFGRTATMAIWQNYLRMQYMQTLMRHNWDAAIGGMLN